MMLDKVQRNWVMATLKLSLLFPNLPRMFFAFAMESSREEESRCGCRELS
jgi:hypothetical protein